MGLNIAKGNMYDFVTHTWNTVKGACPHDCSYCYMKRFGKQKPVRLDAKELKTDLGEGNFIFVGSSCDMFAKSIPKDWINKTLFDCMWSYNNMYLLQSKNPMRIVYYRDVLPTMTTICTTIETNRIYKHIMNACPTPENRASAMGQLVTTPRFVTIEPVMDFDIEPMVELIKRCEPTQVNIGADSGNNHLPEPTLGKIMELVEELNKFTKVAKKRNIERLIGGNNV